MSHVISVTEQVYLMHYFGPIKTRKITQNGKGYLSIMLPNFLGLNTSGSLYVLYLINRIGSSEKECFIFALALNA